MGVNPASPDLFDKPDLADTKAKPWTTAEIVAGLKVLYAPPSHALLFGVPDGTGGHKTRTADALAMSLWPSRGIHLAGFEIKASRSDWVRELAEPAKAEALARYCDRWYLVVGSTAIVGVGELPPNWGLIAPSKGKLRIAVEAKPLDPRPVDRGFLAAIFRRATETIVAEDPVRRAREEGVRVGYEKGIEAGKQSDTFERDRLRVEAESLRKAIADFEAASGLRLNQWDAGRIGDAVRLVMQGGVDVATRKMKGIADEARLILDIAGRYGSQFDGKGGADA